MTRQWINQSRVSPQPPSRARALIPACPVSLALPLHLLPSQTCCSLYQLQPHRPRCTQQMGKNPIHIPCMCPTGELGIYLMVRSK